MSDDQRGNEVVKPQGVAAAPRLVPTQKVTPPSTPLPVTTSPAKAVSPTVTPEIATRVPDEFRGSTNQELIDWLQERVDSMKGGLLTEEQLNKLRKRQAAQRMISGIADMGRAIANIAATSQYAPNAYVHERDSLSERMQQRFDKEKADRDADNDRFFNLAMTLGRLKGDERDRGLKLWQMDQSLAQQAKAAAVQDAENEHKAALRPFELRKAEADAKRAESNEILQAVRAGMEPELIKAKIEKYYNGSRKGGGQGSNRYYGTLDGVAYRTKADYDKALAELAEEYGVPVIEELETVKDGGYSKTTRDARRPNGSVAADVEAETAKRRSQQNSAYTNLSKLNW